MTTFKQLLSFAILLAIAHVQANSESLSIFRCSECDDWIGCAGNKPHYLKVSSVDLDRVPVVDDTVIGDCAKTTGILNPLLSAAGAGTACHGGVSKDGTKRYKGGYIVNVGYEVADNCNATADAINQKIAGAAVLAKVACVPRTEPASYIGNMLSVPGDITACKPVACALNDVVGAFDPDCPVPTAAPTASPTTSPTASPTASVAVPTPTCKGIGAVECSKCSCYQKLGEWLLDREHVEEHGFPSCSTEDSKWCSANMDTGNNCTQYSTCPHDGDKAVVAETTVEVKTLQITIKADVDLSKLNTADFKKFADAGKATALAAGVPADQIKDIKYFQEVLNADGTSKDPKELKEIKAPTSRRARRAVFFGPITFEIVFKDTATVDLATLAKKVNVAIDEGKVPFTVELSTGKLTGTVKEAAMVVVEVKVDGIVAPVSGSSTTTFAAGLIATLAAVATIV